MTDTEDRPTVQETYQRATQSSHLEVRTHCRGDVDILIAAGWVASGPRHVGTQSQRRILSERERARRSLAVLLYRLSGEYDNVRADVQAMEREWERQQKESRNDADLLVSAIRSMARTRRMIISRLKTMAAAREAFGRYATLVATTGRFLTIDDARAAELAGVVLGAFLSPRCDRCQGRGFTGNEFEGSLRTLCPTRNGCGGSGKRRPFEREDGACREFCERLITDMESMKSEVAVALSCLTAG